MGGGRGKTAGGEDGERARDGGCAPEPPAADGAAAAKLGRMEGMG